VRIEKKPVVTRGPVALWCADRGSMTPHVKPCALGHVAQRFDLMLRITLLACLSVAACAHETSERPLPPSSITAPTPAGSSPPLPESAFRSDEEMRGARAAPTSAPTSRFETRKIGGDQAPAARYRGAKIDLDLKSAEIGNVLRLLAEVGHVNIVVAGEITGTVTLRMKQVPWDQALDVIARAKNLDLEHDGNVIIVRSR
jgi:hypothetical protein